MFLKTPLQFLQRLVDPDVDVVVLEYEIMRERVLESIPDIDRGRDVVIDKKVHKKVAELLGCFKGLDSLCKSVLSFMAVAHQETSIP